MLEITIEDKYYYIYLDEEQTLVETKEITRYNGNIWFLLTTKMEV